MAHVVGVPKRDPCRKCQLPVFLAERLMVGKKVYHRTCLKCARCGYQLTPGSFYETEVDDQYCCETCPDEELTSEMELTNENETTASSSTDCKAVELRNKFKRETSPTRSVRSSVKERLAFFESQHDDGETDTKLLQKSLSDEEKSKSLQSVENYPTSYKPNKAFTSFFNNSVSGEEDDISEESNSKIEMSDSVDEDTDNSTHVSIPPELPKSMPPLDEHSVERKYEESTKRFTSSAQLVLESTTKEPTEMSNDPENVGLETVNHENQTSEIKISLSSSISIDRANNNSIHDEEQITTESTKAESKAEQTNDEVIQLHQNKIDNNVEFSKTNDNDCVTKDKPTDELIIENIEASAEQPFDDLDTDFQTIQPLQNELNLNIESLNDDGREGFCTTKSKKNDSLSLEDEDITQRLSVVRARLQQFEGIKDNEESEILVPPFVHENCVENVIPIQNVIESSESINMKSETRNSCESSNVNTETENLNSTANDNKVPLTVETEDNENLENKLENNNNKNNTQKPQRHLIKTTIEEYPQDLNPFKSDEENDEEVCRDSNKENVELKTTRLIEKKNNLNPFDSSDDEVELEKSQNSRSSSSSTPRIPPPRPPPPRISKNPFGSEDEDDGIQNFQRRSSLTVSQSKKQPVPTPRTNISKTSTPNSSTVGTPKSARKKRPAPAPPKPARLDSAHVPQIQVTNTIEMQSKNSNSYPLQSELDSKLSDEEKALLEGKTLQSSMHCNETGLTLSPKSKRSSKRLIPLDKELLEEHGSLQYVEGGSSQCDDLKERNQLKNSASEGDELNVVYRRILIPQNLETPTHEHNPLVENLNKSTPLGERQLEKIKDNKEANNRNRQSQISVASSGADDNDPLFNKSAHGKWKRRKGPAPALPIPARKSLQMLPLQEIKHELEIIEVQQQGLEKQGVILEKMIRDRCEGENGEPLKTSGTPGGNEDTASAGTENSKEVENLILQLFELVNEKNELFRRQAELMYLRRQHRLEQEQADLEYEIRILMAQPERNKTDSDKAREEALIERLLEVVKLRNEVVECLEMDRIREAEEDQSIKQRLESHIARRDNDSNTKRPLSKLSKKEKKKQKEAKKLIKSKKLDADKDADESEFNLDKEKSKKKKKLLIF
ncbi:hypothetical protein DOY81_011067 [Sarcophaga bullata]|nr:hypothetical protein DOY81_011067 [Sarcophaga bullata]